MRAKKTPFVTVFLLVLVSLLWCVVILPGSTKLSSSVALQYDLLPSQICNVTYDESLVVDPWLVEQQQRRIALKKACNKFLNGKPPLSALSLARQRKKMLRNLIVDDIHHVLYCYIPKIACTNWKRIMMIMSGRTNATKPLDISSWIPHEPQALSKLSSSRKLQFVAERLKSYTKFLFVRHPFERLLSAYRNKIEPKNTTSSRIMKLNFGKFMVENYKEGDFISFSQFVDYLIRIDTHPPPNGEKYNEHWAPFTDLCHPCHVNYDFIGRYETLEDDADRLLYYLHAPSNIHFPTRNSNTTSLVYQYYNTLSETQIKSLYNIYEADFSLFGYENSISPLLKKK